MATTYINSLTNFQLHFHHACKNAAMLFTMKMFYRINLTIKNIKIPPIKILCYSYNITVSEDIAVRYISVSIPTIKTILNHKLVQFSMSTNIYPMHMYILLQSIVQYGYTYT